MGIFARLRSWQKGFVFGFFFTTLLAILHTVILIYLDMKLEKEGLPHMCFAFTESVVCSFEEAIYTRLGFVVVLVLVFAVPAGIFGALIGYLIERMKISR